MKNDSIGFGSLLTLAFIILKLTNTIDWSWFWVLSPVIIPTLFVLFLFIITMMLKDE